MLHLHLEAAGLLTIFVRCSKCLFRNKKEENRGPRCIDCPRDDARNAWEVRNPASTAFVVAIAIGRNAREQRLQVKYQSYHISQ